MKMERKWKAVENDVEQKILKMKEQRQVEMKNRVHLQKDKNPKEVAVVDEFFDKIAELFL